MNTDDQRDRFGRLEVDKLMGGIRIPAVRPCVVVNETATGYVSFKHYDRQGFRVHNSARSSFTAEAWGNALAYADIRALPVFRTGTHKTAGES